MFGRCPAGGGLRAGGGRPYAGPGGPGSSAAARDVARRACRRGPRAMPGAGRWLKNHPPRTTAHPLLTGREAGPGPRARPVSLTVPASDRRGGGGRHGTTFIPMPIAAGPERSFLPEPPAIPGSQFPAAGCGGSGRGPERATGVRQQAGRSREILSPGEGGADDGGDHVDQSAGVAVEGGAVVAVPFEVAVVPEPQGAVARAGPGCLPRCRWWPRMIPGPHTPSGRRSGPGLAGTAPRSP